MSTFKLPKHVYSNEHLLGILSELDEIMIPKWLTEENELMNSVPSNSLLLSLDENNHQHFAHNFNPNYKAKAGGGNKNYNSVHATNNTGRYATKKSESYDNSAYNMDNRNQVDEDDSIQSNELNNTKLAKPPTNNFIIHHSLDETRIKKIITETSVDVKEEFLTETVSNNGSVIESNNDSDNVVVAVEKNELMEKTSSEINQSCTVSKKNVSNKQKCATEKIYRNVVQPKIDTSNKDTSDGTESDVNGAEENVEYTRGKQSTGQPYKKLPHKSEHRVNTKEKLANNKNVRAKPHYDPKSKISATNNQPPNGRNTTPSNSRIYNSKKNENVSSSMNCSKPPSATINNSHNQPKSKNGANNINAQMCGVNSKKTNSHDVPLITPLPIVSIDEIMQEQMIEKLNEDKKKQQELDEKIRTRKEKDNFWKEIQVEAISIEQLELEEKAKILSSINSNSGDTKIKNVRKNNSNNSDGKFWENAMKFY